jgi:hypothetical protein
MEPAASQGRNHWLAGGILAFGILIVVVAIAARGRGSGHQAARTTQPAGTAVFAEPDHDHVTGTVRYDRIPPAGGAHNDVWLNCGVYSEPVRNENAVHSLEHGAVWITYRPGLASAGVARLHRFVKAHYKGEERYLILSPYAGLPALVVASAWGRQLRLKGPGDPRLGEFVARFAGGGQGGEAEGPCSGGTGTPTG